MSSVDAPAAPTAPPVRRRRGGPGGVTSAFWLFVGPFLIGLIVFVYVPIVWSVVLELLPRSEHGDAGGLGRLPELPGPALDRAVPGQPDHLHRLRGLHRAADVRPVAGVGAAAQQHHRSRARSSARCSSCRPPARYVVASLDLEALDLQRRPLRPGQQGDRRLRGRQRRLVGHHRPALVLAGDRHGPALAPDRLLHDLVPGRVAADLAGALRGCGGGRRPQRLADVPATSPSRSCAPPPWRYCCCC